VWDSAVDEVLGKETVDGVLVKNLKTNATQTLPVAGFFVAIGTSPTPKFLKPDPAG